MNNTVIKAENLSKQYRLGQIGTGSLAHDINRWWYNVRGKENPYLKIGEPTNSSTKGNNEYVWSLKDINFEIEQGDAVGIIGRNGAGKSTLLKILSRVTAPTKGTVKIKGRIASLLEVGTGFHPELSGRENIFLNGAILGMRKKEIQHKFDEIVDFAGVEKYIDTPVKRYSSGMYVRLAFAVAANLESEILIVDEVLAVGDAEFQKKCLGKMSDVSKGEGKTVLFVSHNLDAITRLCNTAIYLQSGAIKSKGNSDKVLNNYLSGEIKTKSSSSWDLHEAPGNLEVKLRCVRIIDENEQESFTIDIRKKTGVEITFEVIEDLHNYVCGFNLYNQQGVHILSSHDLMNQNKKLNKELHKVIGWIPGNFLAEGIHTISVAVMSYNPFHVHLHQMNAASFNIIDVMHNDTSRGSYGGIFPGVVRPKLEWSEIKKIEMHQ